jgi:hypothetical protein
MTIDGTPVLVQVDATEDPERDRHQRRRAGDQQRADDGRAHAAAGQPVDERHVVVEEAPAEDLRALLHHVPDEEDERDQRDQEAEPDHTRGDEVLELAHARLRQRCDRRRERGHATAPDLRS